MKSILTKNRISKYHLILLLLAPMLLTAQKENPKDEALYKIKQSGFYQDSILPAIDAFNAVPDKTKSYLSMDFKDQEFPTDPTLYKTYWHSAPLSQGATGTCWCFSTVSFLESEINRLHHIQVKLSEMYIVYWEYVARAEYFVKTRGDMYLGEGSETNAVTRIIKEKGLVPANAYSGMLQDQRFHDHNQLFKEIKNYLGQVKANNAWDPDAVVATVKGILNHYMQAPPEQFMYEGKKYTPLSFMNDYLKVIPDDYFCFMSTKSKTFNQKGELEEPDNWWHNDDYYNIPLNEFNSLLKEALQNGFTAAICGDVSEPGYDRFQEVGIIPTFDIPGDYIDENAREYRISNNTTTDDHCIHIVGIYEDEGTTWLMIKDSSSSGFDGPHKGYRFLREDYVKLKILAAMLHKDAARPVLDKIIK
jgi:bleomycin hydrolase